MEETEVLPLEEGLPLEIPIHIPREAMDLLPTTLVRTFKIPMVLTST
jgi:hypothetical protein